MVCLARERGHTLAWAWCGALDMLCPIEHVPPCAYASLLVISQMVFNGRSDWAASLCDGIKAQKLAWWVIWRCSL